MKKIGILVLLAGLLSIATAVMADAGGVPAWPDQPGSHRPLDPGDRALDLHLNLWGPSPISMPANEPFSVGHGWWWLMPHPELWAVNNKAEGIFTLKIDGVQQEYDYIRVRMFPAVQSPIGEHLRETLWVFNFTDGFEGTHEFLGEWWIKCQLLADYGYLPSCADPEEFLLFDSRSVIVNFE